MCSFGKTTNTYLLRKWREALKALEEIKLAESQDEVAQLQPAIAVISKLSSTRTIGVTSQAWAFERKAAIMIMHAAKSHAIHGYHGNKLEKSLNGFL